MPMAPRSDAPVRAILGPTNTGKTYLAIERMCGHSSGVIGFPLRLLAREVYDRVVAIKGDGHVALMTGEERIVPPKARYFLCTAESMPSRQRQPARRRAQRDFAFAAIDEAQLAVDPERGHIFTDRLLHARGREETMLLGSAPSSRWSGRCSRSRDRQPAALLDPSLCRHVKLSRLPPRSALVAFSAEQVYALAEMLRRFRGGAAVVMGALQPRDAQPPGRLVPARRGRLSRRHRRHRHGPQHGRHPCRFRRAREVRRPPRPPPDPRRNGADRRPRRTPPARRQLRHARPRARTAPLSPTKRSTRSRSIASARSTSSSGAMPTSTSDVRR